MHGMKLAGQKIHRQADLPDKTAENEEGAEPSGHQEDPELPDFCGQPTGFLIDIEECQNEHVDDGCMDCSHNDDRNSAGADISTRC